MNSTPNLWRSLAERDRTSEPAVDLNPAIFDAVENVSDVEASRRSFLQLAGFSVAAAAAAGCSRASEEKIVPYVTPPEDIVPGRSYWVATTCNGCSAGCGVLAKGRDGRPIKLEGNPEHPASQGGLCAAGQASLLSLYDSHRYFGPLSAGRQADWQAVDGELRASLAAAASAGGAVRILTGSVTSPSTRAAIDAFLERFDDARHVEYDALSAASILDAHQRTHRARVMPRYRFENAKRIVSFGADFLGAWISPVEYTAGWKHGRKPEGGDHAMSRHIQFEARMSLTGTCADERVRLAPQEAAAQVAHLATLLDVDGSRGLQKHVPQGTEAHPAIVKWADELTHHKGESLVVCDSDDVAVQSLVNAINELLESYGKTIDLEHYSHQRRGSDAALAGLEAELRAGKVSFLLVAGCNPAYDWPGESGLAGALPLAGTLAACSSLEDETSALAQYVLPEPHALEAWDDHEAINGTIGLRQPTVQPLRSGRTLRATLARLTGDERSERELLADYWRSRVSVPRSLEGGATFENFFAHALERGYFEHASDRVSASRMSWGSLAAPAVAAPAAGSMALVLYPKVGLLDGRHAHNPWLQELPDPVTKVVWDNYACLAPAKARELDVEEGDHVSVALDDGGPTLELPVYVQPGQHPEVVAVAVGYGRAGTDRFSNVGPGWLQASSTVEPGATVGQNAAVWSFAPEGRPAARHAAVTKTSGSTQLACTQDHHRLDLPAHLAPAGHEKREAVLATTLSEFEHDPEHALHHGGHAPSGELWQQDHEGPFPSWGLAIDLTACTGCSACVVACQAENNVPVVGKDEVRRHREMSWIRIDRYFDGDEDDTRAYHQPMMCQHCDHAPCETVCPVLATVHSRDGLNQQVYNRCVGTRYCANNCPYKVRRFNWFDYPREDKLQNMSLNPEVAIRSRGVMEKCSMCVQRVVEARIDAKQRGVPVQDGAIQTACQQSCPSQAIVFGDLTDANSRVANQASGARAYRVLEEINVKPAVNYLAVVRNPGEGGAQHG